MSRYSIVKTSKKAKVIITDKRKTKPYMSIYEYAALVSARCAQLTSRFESTPPKVTLDKPSDYDPMYIAMKEIRAKSVNLVVRRHLPDGTTEDFSLQQSVTGISSRPIRSQGGISGQ